MTVAEAQRLFGYNAWANARLVAVLSGLSEDAFRTPVGSSFGSVRDTLAHILAGEWIWLRRAKGDNPTGPPSWVAAADRAGLLAKLAEIETERRDFLASLTQAQLDATITYRLLSGQEHRNTLAELLQHVVNHSTYHRGQAVTQLRQLGVTPPSTDLIAFLWEND